MRFSIPIIIFKGYLVEPIVGISTGGDNHHYYEIKKSMN